MYKKRHVQPSEMVQCVKHLSHKPDDLSLILEPTVKGENQPLKVVLNRHMHAFIPPHSNINHKQNKVINKNKIGKMVSIEYAEVGFAYVLRESMAVIIFKHIWRHVNV